MRKLYDNFLKRQLIDEIQRLGQGICEIMVDIPLSFSTINSIEFNNREGLITIHVFEFPDYEINYDFDDLEVEDKIKIIQTLKTI